MIRLVDVRVDISSNLWEIYIRLLKLGKIKKTEFNNLSPF